MSFGPPRPPEGPPPGFPPPPPRSETDAFLNSLGPGAGGGGAAPAAAGGAGFGDLGFDDGGMAAAAAGGGGLGYGGGGGDAADQALQQAIAAARVVGDMSSSMGSSSDSEGGGASGGSADAKRQRLTTQYPHLWRLLRGTSASAEQLGILLGAHGSAGMIQLAEALGRKQQQVNQYVVTGSPPDAQATTADALVGEMYDVLEGSDLGSQLQVAETTEGNALQRLNRLRLLTTRRVAEIDSAGGAAAGGARAGGGGGGAAASTFGILQAAHGAFAPTADSQAHVAKAAEVSARVVDDLTKEYEKRGSPLRAWADAVPTVGDGGAADPAPLNAVRYNMSDDRSREVFKSALQPRLLTALDADRAGRVVRAKGELRTVLGVAAMDNRQVKRHLAAILSLRLALLTSPTELVAAAAQPGTGAFGVQLVGRTTSVSAVLTATARAVKQAFPEIDTTPFSEAVTSVNNLLADDGEHVQEHAQLLYTDSVCRPLQRTADAIRRGDAVPMQLASDPKIFIATIAARVDIARENAARDARYVVKGGAGGGGAPSPAAAPLGAGLGAGPPKGKFLDVLFGFELGGKKAADTLDSWRKTFGDACIYGAFGKCGRKPGDCQHCKKPVDTAARDAWQDEARKLL